MPLKSYADTEGGTEDECFNPQCAENFFVTAELITASGIQRCVDSLKELCFHFPGCIIFGHENFNAIAHREHQERRPFVFQDRIAERQAVVEKQVVAITIAGGRRDVHKADVEA